VARRGRRRGRRGDGSITERDGKYLARISTTEGGVRKRQSKTFDLRNDAEWWLSQARRHGEAPEDIRVADYLERWLNGKRRIRESTRRQYEEHVRLHLGPLLGRHRLVDLRRRHVEALVDDRLRYVSPRTGRPLSPATVGKILVTLRSALEAAVPRDIPDNPAARVEAPATARRQVRAMTPAEAAAIIGAVRGTWMEHIVRVLLGSGLRLGEATALNQGDVHDGWVGLRESKTTIRSVRLSVDADEAIHAAIRAAPRRGAREPVFYGPRTGDRLRGSTLTHALPRQLERAGVAGLTPHLLRHGTATLMVGAGVPMRMVAEQLGHANPSMTAKVYAHVSPESQVAALAVLDEAVKG
jgi:integrase